MTEVPPVDRASGAGSAGGVDVVAAEPARRVGKRWIAFIALANLGLYLGYFGPITVLLPNQVQAIAGPAHKVAVLGWVTGIGAAVAMISNPVAGALSDRTTSRFGRRHPWTVCGALAGAAALVLLAGQHAIAAATRRPAALRVARLRPLVLAEPTALSRLRLGLADPVRGQSRQRDGPAVPAVLPARQDPLRPDVPRPEGRGRPARPHPHLHGR